MSLGLKSHRGQEKESSSRKKGGGERKNKEKQKPLTQGKNVHEKTEVHIRKGLFSEKRDFKIYRKPKKY